MSDPALDLTILPHIGRLVRRIPDIGLNYHAQRMVRQARANKPYILKQLRDLPPLPDKKSQSGIVISAGPSLYRKKSIQKIKDSNYQGALIAVDGSYIACLKAGLIPDYLLTLDPHPTRMVRWFGDPDIQNNARHDDYFDRQDLDVTLRHSTIEENRKNIELVNHHGQGAKAIVASSAPINVIQRMREAKFDLYGWNPLVDNPKKPGSLTRRLYRINSLTCMNTGGTVGTAAWVFAHAILKLPAIALVGMDFGYYQDTPITHTHCYYELVKRLGDHRKAAQYFMDYTFPLTGEKFYTDPTYIWYRKNFLELFEKSSCTTFNCTEGGTLYHKRLKTITLDEFLSHG